MRLPAGWGLLLALAALPAAAAQPSQPPALSRAAPHELRLAQSGQPVPLLPPGHPGAVMAAPLAPTPVNPAPGTVTPVLPQPSTGPKGIQIDKLSGPDADTLGTLDPGSGLGVDLWRGLTRADLAGLITALPAALISPTLRDLQRRLLLSTANAPEGTGGVSLAGLRARKLAEMGATEDLQALASVLPSRLDDEDLARGRVEANLLNADNNDACNDARAFIHRYHDLFWQKALVFCQLLDGKRDEADLALGLLREQDDNKDTAFYSLVERLEGNRNARLGAVTQLSPLILAMMAAAKAALPADAVKELMRDPAHGIPASIVRTLAVSNLAPPELRLAAAERAGAIGLLDPDELGTVYDTIAVGPGEIANAVAKARQTYGSRARALLYRAAKAQTDMPARAELIAAALDLARQGGIYDIAVLVDLPLMDDIHPAPDTMGFALEGGRALFYAGHGEASEVWLQLARQNAASDPRATEAAAALWPYARLAGSKLATFDGAAIERWRQAQHDGFGAPHEARLLTLLGAVGDQPPADRWQRLYAEGLTSETAPMPSPALMHGIADAAAAGQRGKGVIMILLALGAQSPAEMNTSAVAAAIVALRRLGLESDARQLAVEAAIAGGV
jgi:hypothetical protein